MLLNPAILALLLVSLVVVWMLLLASFFAVQVHQHWDLQSGSERQLKLERRTYLISTLLSWAFAAELISLLLFIYNAESLSGQFVGAMCATGVLNVNAWGWPTLFLKLAVFFVAAIWLVINRLDNKGYDYPLIRTKYLVLLLLLPLVISEAISQWYFFSQMNPAVITSCCGTLFSADAEGVAAEVSALSPRDAIGLFVASGLALIGSGLLYQRYQRWGMLFAATAMFALTTAFVGTVSFISPYVYEHPHHHCPFCLLKAGHGYVGYMLYIPLFVGATSAVAAGLIHRWRHIPSLSDAIAGSRQKMIFIALSLLAFFYALSFYLVATSNLTMQGVWW